MIWDEPQQDNAPTVVITFGLSRTVRVARVGQTHCFFLELMMDVGVSHHPCTCSVD